MSGFISAITAARQLFGGYGSVTLGPVKLQAMEVPDMIPVGGTQALAVHQLPGGGRVIDAMGRNDAAMSWSGILLGIDAESRMLLLDNLRQSGAEIKLAFGLSSYQVVVQSFSGNYMRSNYVPYRISCVVVVDNAAQLSKAKNSLLDTLNNDLNSAVGFNVGAVAESAIGSAQTALNAAGALGLGSSAFASATMALSGASAALGLVQGVASGSIAGVIAGSATAGNFLGVGQIGNAATALNSVLTATGDLASSVQAGAYVIRAATNLANTSA